MAAAATVRGAVLATALAAGGGVLALLAVVGHGGTAGASLDRSDPALSFARLASPASAADAIGPAERQGLAAVAASRGVDLDGSRATGSVLAGGAVRLLPGVDRLCLSVPDPVEGDAVACATAEAAADGRLWTALVGMPGQRPGDARVAIAVPDDADAVTAVSAHGERRALPVAGNVTVADLTDTAAYEMRRGDTTTQVALPGTPVALARE